MGNREEEIKQIKRDTELNCWVGVMYGFAIGFVIASLIWELF